MAKRLQLNSGRVKSGTPEAPRRTTTAAGSARRPAKTPRRIPDAARSARPVRTAPPLPPQPAPAPDALALYETGVRALQRKSYERAATAFRSLIDGFPLERALLDRARVYHDLAERELRRAPAAPQTVEERLTAATVALNNDDEDQAERLVRSVLTDEPARDLALYLLAAITARRGQREAALGHLHDAIASNPDVRVQARHDEDFASLRHLDTFRAMVDPGPARRGRRPRS